MNKSNLFYRITYFLAILSLLFSCRSEEITRNSRTATPLNLNKTNSSDQTRLFISPSHINDLVPIGKSEYNRNDLKDLFNLLKIKGDEYCEMKFHLSKFDEKKATSYINKGNLSKYRRTPPGAVENLRAGCWNFFEMNDYRPDIDFQLVRKLYGDTEYDCYSVGFLQPYMMNKELNCSSMTMIDIDWRILEAHYQTIQLLKNAVSGSNLRKLLEKVNLKWFAYDTPPGSSKFAFMDNLCRNIQIDYCNNYFANLSVETFEDLIFRLNLSALPDTLFQKTPETTRIFFLSNAIEEVYTTPSDFNRLLNRAFESLNKNQKMVFIHHVGGWKQFGLYELGHSENNEMKLRTVCRDPYASKARSPDPEKPVYYTTYFDRISSNSENIKTCGFLFGELQKKNPGL